MKTFMGNPCMHGYCMIINCNKCRFYTPTCFGIKVPKWLGNLLFKLEWWLSSRNVKNNILRGNNYDV